MRVGVPKETAEGERRVALVPDVVKALAERKLEVAVEPGAGEGAHHPDAEYSEAGAKLDGEAWGSEVVVKVGPPTSDEIAKLKSGQVLISHLNPLTDGDLSNALASAGVTSFAMEAIPRITRAQAMDALSSQANLAGYMAVIIAAREAGSLFPMMTTAAGTIAPAKVLVLGAGVAGLQAVATAKRLGAIVTGFDVRRAAWEQIASLGGRPLELDFLPDAEAEGGYARPLNDEENEQVRTEVGKAAAKSDIVITTAQIPGRPAPILITAAAIAEMPQGAVIIDLAGESGGNTELTEGGQTVTKEGVTIISPTNLPSEMAEDASALYAKNIQNLLELMVSEEGSLNLDFSDEVIAGACLTHEGEIRNERAREVAAESGGNGKAGPGVEDEEPA